MEDDHEISLRQGRPGREQERRRKRETPPAPEPGGGLAEVAGTVVGDQAPGLIKGLHDGRLQGPLLSGRQVLFHENYTFTIKDKPVENNGKLKIVKRWQDFDGSVGEPDANQVTLKLLQLAQDEPAKRVVWVRFKYYGDDNKTEIKEEVVKREIGCGTATIEWQWAEHVWKGRTIDDIAISPAGAGTVEQIYQDSEGQNKKFRLTIPDTGKNVSIEVLCDNGRYNPYERNRIGNVEFAGDNPTSTFTLTGGSREITLNSGNDWTQEFTYGSQKNAMLSDDNTTVLPVTYLGRPCRYVIAETSIPDGYSVSYSISNAAGEGYNTFNINKDATGVLTAYNRKNKTSVSLVKVDKYNRGKKLSGAKFAIYRINPSQKGVVYMDWVSDEVTTVDGEATFTDLPVGFYEIKETEAPEHYNIVGDGSFYIKVSTNGVVAVERDDERIPEKWKARPNDSMVAVNDGVLVVGNEKDQPVKIKKVDSSDYTNNLKDAEFELYGPYTASEVATGVHLQKPVDRKVNITIKTNEQGEADLNNLKTGYYYLYETKAPSGYNMLTAPVIITVNSQAGAVNYDQYLDNQSTTISSNGEGVTVEEDEDGVITYVLTVINSPGVRLPSTGGSGTTLYYVLGTLLTLAAVAMMIAKRRRDY